ncbi:MAG TPA: hydroxysqualene dehydroxylase HpnE [Casimicrobiaceae bacterium]|nr:hydroxysqualene dehydroxylase HpnE [Casimicrobiaceae bacterium]
MTAPVAIIGGGWAGCAAAVTLADAGVPATLFEAGPVLGGRARRVVVDGLPLDNGQHLMLGAYRETLTLMRRVHGAAVLPVIRRPLAIVPFGDADSDAVTVIARRAPGRLGLAIGLLAARGLTWRERLANVGWMRALERDNYARPPRETVARMLRPLPARVARELWTPLCLAALNTPIATASAQVFANVLRAAFGADGAASDFVIPATDLAALFPEAADGYLRNRGGTLRTGVRARVVAASGDAVTLAVDDAPFAARAAIVAVGPHQLGHAFAPEALAARPALAAAVSAIEALEYEPIVTVWLGYSARVAFPAPIARLDDAPGQWVVDRPDVIARAKAGDVPSFAQLLAVVISASGPHMALPHDALVRAADAQLRRVRPDLSACVWSQVIAEKRATYACTPGRARPAEPRLAPGLYLAGDYVDTEYPATLEAAVRSGIAAAKALLADRVSDVA